MSDTGPMVLWLISVCTFDKSFQFSSIQMPYSIMSHISVALSDDETNAKTENDAVISITNENAVIDNAINRLILAML